MRMFVVLIVPFHKSWFMAVKHGMHLEKAETFSHFMSCVISTIFIFHGRRNPRIISGHYSTRMINHRRFNYFISRWTRINHFGREFPRTLLFNFPRSYNYSLTTFPAELFSLLSPSPFLPLPLSSVRLIVFRIQQRSRTLGKCPFK